MVVQVFIYENGRMWDINPIPYATFIASINILAFYFLLQSRTTKDYIVWFLTLLGSIVPLAYSESRGLWLALAVAMLILLIKTCFTHKKAFYSLPIIVIIALFSSHFGAEKINHRINQTKSEIESIKSGNLDTSIGLRFQMWQAAFLLANESPIIGLGDHHIEYKQNLANKGIISQVIVHFNHYHNQYINDFIKYGFIGLTLLMLCIILPFYYLIKNNNEYKWIGLLILIIFCVASLTDVPFRNGQTLTFYLLIMHISLFRVNLMSKNTLIKQEK